MASNKINSRAKGSKNERDICKWWQEWTGYEFSRVPSSGGLRWHRTADTTGDVICSDKKHFLRFPFSIECKNYKEINFEHLLLGNKNIQILKFWEQAVNDAKRGNKLPILMMRYNGMKKGEYFFVVDYMVGNMILESMDLISRVDINLMTIRSKGSMDVRLHIFMASDIVRLAEYKKVYKEGKLRVKGKR